MEIGAREWLRHERNGSPASILMLDLDRFKLLNDTFGHAAGDVALVSFVATCRENLRSLDIIGRTGGEEFAIVLPDSDLIAACALAERLRTAVANTAVVFSGEALSLSVSVGAAQARAGESLDGAMQRADTALYGAKRAGRNCVSVDTPETAQQSSGP